jgi:hypothetical protein
VKYLFRVGIKEKGTELEEVVEVPDEEIYKHKTDAKKSEYISGLFEKWLFKNISAKFTRIKTNQCCYCECEMSAIMDNFCYSCQRYQPVQIVKKRS